MKIGRLQAVFLGLCLVAFGCAPKFTGAVYEDGAPLHCLEVVVPAFEWLASEDTLYIEHGLEAGKDSPGGGPPSGSEVAVWAVDALNAQGIRARVVDEVSDIETAGVCVLLGRVESWKERIGSSWSVSRSASVSFRVALIEASTRRVLWAEEFEEKQQPLSDNLLAIGRFFSHKAQWVTARTLFEEGCRGLFGSLKGAMTP